MGVDEVFPSHFHIPSPLSSYLLTIFLFCDMALTSSVEFTNYLETLEAMCSDNIDYDAFTSSIQNSHLENFA